MKKSGKKKKVKGQTDSPEVTDRQRSHAAKKQQIAMEKAATTATDSIMAETLEHVYGAGADAEQLDLTDALMQVLENPNIEENLCTKQRVAYHSHYREKVTATVGTKAARKIQHQAQKMARSRGIPIADEFRIALGKVKDGKTQALIKLIQRWTKMPLSFSLEGILENMCRMVCPWTNEACCKPFNSKEVQALHYTENGEPVELVQRQDPYARPMRSFGIFVHGGIIDLYRSALRVQCDHSTKCRFYYYYSSAAIAGVATYSSLEDLSAIGTVVHMHCYVEKLPFSEDRERSWVQDELWGLLPDLLAVASNSEAGALVRLQALRAVTELITQTPWYGCKFSSWEVYVSFLEASLTEAANLFSLEMEDWLQELRRSGDIQADVVSRACWTPGEAAARAPDIMRCIWRDSVLIIKQLVHVLGSGSVSTGQGNKLCHAVRPLRSQGFIKTVMRRLDDELADPVTIMMLSQIMHDMCHDPSLNALLGEEHFIRFLLRMFHDPRKAVLFDCISVLSHLQRRDPNENIPSGDVSCCHLECGEWFEMQMLDCLRRGDLRHVMSVYWEGLESGKYTDIEIHGSEDGSVGHLLLGIDNAVPFIRQGWSLGEGHSSITMPADVVKLSDRIRLKRGQLHNCGDPWLVDYLRQVIKTHSKETFSTNVHKQAVSIVHIFREAAVLADWFPLPNLNTRLPPHKSVAPLELDFHAFRALGLDTQSLWSGRRLCALEMMTRGGLPIAMQWFDSSASSHECPDYNFTGLDQKNHPDLEHYRASKVNSGWREDAATRSLTAIEARRPSLEADNSASHVVLKVSLVGLKPELWRRISVPLMTPLNVLHDKLLCPLFGFKRGIHMFLFEDEPADVNGAPIIVNSHVVISNIVSRVELNGCSGICLNRDPSNDRWFVRLDVGGEGLSLRESCLQRIPTDVTNFGPHSTSLNDQLWLHPECPDRHFAGRVVVDASKVCLLDVVVSSATEASRAGRQWRRLRYWYDLGERYLFTLDVEGVVDPAEASLQMRCIEGGGLGTLLEERNMVDFVGLVNILSDGPPPSCLLPTSPLGGYWEAMFQCIHTRNVTTDVVPHFHLEQAQLCINRVASSNVTRLTKTFSKSQSDHTFGKCFPVEKRCAGCDQSAYEMNNVTLKLCQRCRNVSYCSVHCQKAHHKIHKHICHPKL